MLFRDCGISLWKSKIEENEMPKQQTGNLIALLVLSFALAGCSNVIMALRTSESPGCSTTVVGFFHSGKFWIGKAPKFIRPAICVKDGEGNNREVIPGKVIALREKGIVFLPKKVTLLYTPDTAFFSFDKVVWAIGESGKVVYGELPKGTEQVVWSAKLELSDTAQPEAEHIAMELDPNKPFAYCIPPGTYRVTKITYDADAGEGEECKDESDSLPDILMRVYPHTANYIGDLYLDEHGDSLPDVHDLPAKIVERPEYAAAMTLGLLGALAYESTLGPPPVHTICVKDDSASVASNRKSWRESLLIIRDSLSNKGREP